MRNWPADLWTAAQKITSTHARYHCKPLKRSHAHVIHMPSMVVLPCFGVFYSFGTFDQLWWFVLDLVTGSWMSWIWRHCCMNHLNSQVERCTRVKSVILLENSWVKNMTLRMLKQSRSKAQPWSEPCVYVFWVMCCCRSLRITTKTDAENVCTSIG